MAVGSQTPQESSAKGRVKCTPLQGTEYATKCAGVAPTPKYKNLEEWFQDVSEVHPFSQETKCHRIWPYPVFIKGDADKRVCSSPQNFEQEVIGETEDVEVVRTFYTYRPNSKSGVEVWYADGEFGFYEGLPKRVADLLATHIHVKVRNPNTMESVPRISDSCFFHIRLVSEKIGYRT